MAALADASANGELAWLGQALQNIIASGVAAGGFIPGGSLHFIDSASTSSTLARG
jgi:hypothetical protein